MASSQGHLENNTLLFVGDSVAIEHYTATVCRLRALGRGMVNTTHWEPEPVVFRSSGIWVHCMRYFRPLHPAVCFTHPLHGRASDPLDLINDRQRSLLSLQDALELATNGTRATIVANLGLHYPDPALLFNVTETMLSAFQHIPSMPSVIWRETSAQHFPGRTGLYNASAYVKNSSCESVGAAKNHFNSITNPIANAHGTPIISTWAASVSRWDAHGGRGDCSHWCFGTGVVESWVDSLYQYI